MLGGQRIKIQLRAPHDVASQTHTSSDKTPGRECLEADAYGNAAACSIGRRSTADRATQRVLDTAIDVIAWESAVSRIAAWAAKRESRAVALCNAHSLVTARRDPEFARVLDGMDLATADGMAVVWVMRMLGHRQQQRLNGPDLMWRCCERAETLGLSVFFLGSTEETLERLQQRTASEFPRLRLVGLRSPPFRPMTDEEDLALVTEVNASGANIVFVSLGCPKQETWILRHRGRIASVMLGVGAAFDFHSGVRERAPQWIQDRGFEWLYRLLSEPRRLSGRYFSTNSSFIIGALQQLATARTERRGSISA